MSAAVDEKPTASWPHWTTPLPFLHRVRRVDEIGLDPCSNAKSTVSAALEYSPPKDGLTEPWTQRGLVFVNPPYSVGELARFVAKCASEAQLGAEVIALVPANMDTAWMHDDILGRAQGAFVWRGRIRFGNPPPGKSNTSPRYQSLVAYWGPRVDRFFWAFQGCGKAWRLR